MFIKYPKIKILGDRSNEGILTTPGKIVIQEKVDGANFGFYVKNGTLYFCSHNQNLTDSEQIMKTGIPKHWKGIEPVLKSWYNDPLMFYDNLYYYGESLQKHTINYDNIPGFIGYDILDIDKGSNIYRNIPTGNFINWKWTKKYFEKMELPFINTIKEIEIDPLIHRDQYINHLKSLYKKSVYRDGSAEGIVIKRYDTQQMAKIVDDDFKEKNKKVFGGTEQSKMTDDIKIVETYATPARIEKMIYKLHDEGNEIDMPMMSILYKEVINDFLDEEILEIYQNYKSINFKNLNSLVSKKCKTTLKNIIMSNGNL